MWWNILPAVYSGIKSIEYANQAREYGSTPRPEYEIPEQMTKALRGAEFAAGAFGLPGEGRIQARMGAQTAAAQRGIMQSGQTSAEQIAGIAALDQNTKEQIANLGVEAAQRKDRLQRYLDQTRSQYANYEDKKWQLNKFDPYLNAMRAAREAELASTQGFASTLQSFANFGNQAAESMKSNPEWWGIDKNSSGVAGGASDKTGMNPNNMFDYPEMDFTRQVLEPSLAGLYGEGNGNYDVYSHYGMPTMYNRMLNEELRKHGKG